MQKQLSAHGSLHQSEDHAAAVPVPKGKAARLQGKERRRTQCKGRSWSSRYVLVSLLSQQLGRRLRVEEKRIYLLDVLSCNCISARCFDQDCSRGQQLHDIPERGVCANLTQKKQCLFLNGQALCLSADTKYLHNLLHRIRHGPNDDQPIKQVNGHAMGRDDVSAADGTNASVCCKDHNRAESRLQGTVEICEALNVQHVHLIDEKHARYKLCNPLVNVPVHDLVDLQSQFLCDLCLLGFEKRTHEAVQVLPTLRLCICHVQIVQGYILHNFLLLVDVSLWHRHVLIRLEVKLCGIGIAPANTSRRTTVGLNVNDVARSHFFFLQAFIDLWRQFQHLLAFSGLQADHHSCDLLAITSCRVWSLFWGQLGHLSLIHFLCFFDPNADGSPAIFHENLRLFDLRRVDLTADHWAEGNLNAKILCDG
mmetsp:Transcript_460/g.904  ORF Transcript_460/g.904 Transcript_460/m.904 type:complete len:423 (+) Transcript_460:269-1537(+)